MPVYLYGIHAVTEALQNIKRKKHKLWCIDSKVEQYKKHNPGTVSRPELDKAFPASCHQGVVLETEPLPSDLSQVLSSKKAILLDHMQDLRNIGAIIRTAAALGFESVIISASAQCPNVLESKNYGQVGKAASGGLEHVNLAVIKNVSNCLQTLKDSGFWIVGLDETGEDLAKAPAFDKVCLVVGQEGKGMRELTKQRCDVLASLPTNPAFPCLNASNAATLGMFILGQQG